MADLRFPWRDLDRDVRQGRTAYALTRTEGRQAAEKAQREAETGTRRPDPGTGRGEAHGAGTGQSQRRGGAQRPGCGNDQCGCDTG